MLQRWAQVGMAGNDLVAIANHLDDSEVTTGVAVGNRYAGSPRYLRRSGGYPFGLGEPPESSLVRLTFL